MQIQLETIQPDSESSFSLLVNPRLSDFFYWHFHPELELVYIEGASGSRIDQNYERKIDIGEVANISNLSETAFCRYFKKMTRLTFTEFLNHYRINQAQKLLLLDKNSSETCYDCGFESLLYFNRIFKKITNENPLAFKKRHLGK